MLKIFPIPAFKDNYIWTIINSKQAIVINPGESKPVIIEVFEIIRNWKDNF